jgi:hypothetical protein
MLAVERERIDSTNRRTEIAREAIQLSDVADKRQFDYRMEDLRTRDESDRRRHALASRILGGGGIVCTLLLLSFLGMAFFAPPDKSALALDFLKVIFTGLGGGGVLTLIIQIVRWMLRPPRLLKANKMPLQARLGRAVSGSVVLTPPPQKDARLLLKRARLCQAIDREASCP